MKQSSKPVKAEAPRGQKAAEEHVNKAEHTAAAKMVAVVLVRGMIGMNPDIRDTLIMMRLRAKNACVVIEATESNLGMINKVKDYVTWGEIDDSTLRLLIEKRAEKNPRDPARTKPFFRLNSPRKGFGRKGVKISFSKGGAMGYRGEKINDLVKRML